MPREDALLLALLNDVLSGLTWANTHTDGNAVQYRDLITRVRSEIAALEDLSVSEDVDAASLRAAEELLDDSRLRAVEACLWDLYPDSAKRHGIRRPTDK